MATTRRRTVTRRTDIASTSTTCSPDYSRHAVLAGVFWMSAVEAGNRYPALQQWPLRVRGRRALLRRTDVLEPSASEGDKTSSLRCGLVARFAEVREHGREHHYWVLAIRH
jgi:hypothetical protein